MCYYPDYDKLEYKEREKLSKLSIHTIEKIEYGLDKNIQHEWMDDNCFCFNIIINGIKISFWWVDAAYLAACLYWDVSIDASIKVIALIQSQVEIFEENEKRKR